MRSEAGRTSAALQGLHQAVSECGPFLLGPVRQAKAKSASGPGPGGPGKIDGWSDPHRDAGPYGWG